MARERCHRPSPGTCECVTFQGKRDFADVMQDPEMGR